MKLWSARKPYSSLTGSGDGHLLVMYVKVVGRVVVSYGCEHFSHDGCARSRADRATRRPRNLRARYIFLIVYLAEMEAATLVKL